MTTLRQKKAIANIVENGGNVSKAMRDAGYSEKTAKTPQKLTESTAYLTLVDQLPDDLLVKVHLEGLNAGKTVFKNNMTSGEVEEVGYEPDYLVRHKYLDSAYKIKGSYAAEKHINLNINEESSERTQGLADRLNGLLRR